MMLKRQGQLLATALLAALALPMGNAAAFDESVESSSAGFSKPLNVQVGPRPYYLVDQLQNGPLKSKLKACESSASFGFPWHNLMYCQHRCARLLC